MNFKRKQTRRKFCARCISVAIFPLFDEPPAVAYAADEGAFLCATEVPEFKPVLDLQSDDDPAILDLGEAEVQIAELGPQGVAHSQLRWRPSDAMPSNPGKIRLGVSFAGKPGDRWKEEVQMRAERWLEDGSSLANVISFEFLDDPSQAQIIVGEGGKEGRPAVNKSLVGRSAKYQRLDDHQSTMFIDDLSSVEHEFGHALCLGHEHKHEALPVKIDPKKAIQYFHDKFGWDESKTIKNVLVSGERCLGDKQFNPKSVMLYPIPPEILERPNTEYFRYTSIHERDRKCLEYLYGAG